MSPNADRRGRPISPADVVDLFVYVVVLNLAAQYIPSIIVETFSVSLLTALLLKVVLEIVLIAKQAVTSRLKAATGPAAKVVGGLLLWVVAVGSKFLVLALEDLLLGDAVSLGGFVAVTGLIITLLLARAGVRWLMRLPVDEPSSAVALT